MEKHVNQTNAGLQITPEDLDEHPLNLAKTIPSHWYYDPSILDFELRTIFQSSWHCAGHLSRLKNPGDFFLMTVLGNPLIILKDHQGNVRAFYNVCKHRGGPLAHDDGACKVFTCKYHGWVYGLDGSLKGVPGFEGVDGFEKSEVTLTPVKLDMWNGFIFVSFGDSVEPLGKIFRGFNRAIGDLDMTDKVFSSRVSYIADCNWKLFVDNFIEGYHIPHVHPDWGDFMDFDKYHTKTYDWFSVQVSPYTGKENLYNETDGEAYFCFFYPNFLLNIVGDRVQSNLILPLSPTKSLVVFDYYYSESIIKHDKGLIKEDVKYSDQIQVEDIGICEQVQQNLRTAAYDRGRLSVKMENGIHHFQNLVRRSYRRGLEKVEASRSNIAR